MNEILNHPSFKKDFAFIRQLESQNKAYQDKVWEKFVRNFSRNDDDIRIVNTRFEAHPSGLSSESEKSVDTGQEEWGNESSFRLSNSSLDFQKLKERSKSLSRTKSILSETQRKKLRKKLTKHIENGTLEQFELNIGDNASNKSKKQNNEKQTSKMNSSEEVFSEESSRSSSSSKTISGGSEKENETETENDPKTDVMIKMSEEIERLKTQLKIREKKRNDSKTKVGARKIRSNGDKGRRRSSLEMNKPADLRKSRYYMEKSIAILKEISSKMKTGITIPDGSDDYARSQVRTKEFTSRFSRIYLYPLLTQISQLNASSRFTPIYQLVYQALQACSNHLPNTIGNASYQKLRECLNCAVEICEKRQKFVEGEVNLDNDEYVAIFRSHCVDLKQEIEGNFLSVSVGSSVFTKNTKSVVQVPSRNKNMNRYYEDRKDIEKKLSMYSSNLSQRRDRHWRKMMAAYEARKPKVKSRYRTATFKHRPPVERISSQVEIEPKHHRLDDMKSLEFLRRSPLVTPVNDDNIQTMVQFDNYRLEDTENKKDVGEVNVGQLSYIEEEQPQEDIFTKLLHLVQSNNEQEQGETEINLTNTIMVLQKCLNLKNQNCETAKDERTDRNSQFTVQNSAMEVQSHTNLKKNKKEPEITVTGSKNAQLICIKDENSVISISEEDIDSKSQPECQKKNVRTAEVQTCEQLPKDEYASLTQRSKSSIKISRIKRPRRLLQLLPKTYAINIIQYKLMFYKHHKGNYMYKKTLTMKPWELLDKISEELLDYALSGIAKEIEVNELVENLFNAEFQY